MTNKNDTTPPIHSDPAGGNLVHESGSENFIAEVWQLVNAVGRLLDDKYSEGDQAVRDELWKRMHYQNTYVRECLDNMRQSKLPPPSQPGKEETVVKLSADNEFLVIRGNRYLIIDIDSLTNASVMTIGPNPGQYTGEHDLPISKAIQMFNQTADPNGDFTPYQRGLTPNPQPLQPVGKEGYWDSSHHFTEPQPHEQGKDEASFKSQYLEIQDRYGKLLDDYHSVWSQLQALKSKPSEEEIDIEIKERYPMDDKYDKEVNKIQMYERQAFKAAIQWLSSNQKTKQ